jgi:hypothetical protein
VELTDQYRDKGRVNFRDLKTVWFLVVAGRIIFGTGFETSYFLLHDVMMSEMFYSFHCLSWLFLAWP